MLAWLAACSLLRLHSKIHTVCRMRVRVPELRNNMPVANIPCF